MASLGTERDWIIVFVMAVCWGVFMFFLDRNFARRRFLPDRKPAGSLFGVSLKPLSRTRIGSILVLAFCSFDFAFLAWFGKRSLQDGLLLVLVVGNLALLAILLGFRLLLRAQSESHSQ